MANSSKNGSDQAKATKSKEDLAKAAAKASANKQSQNSRNKNAQGKKTGLIAYLRGVRQEFKKVVWPTKEELATDTVVVFACVIFFAVAFWLIDTGFLAALKGLLGITLS
ncbi:MAG: preprotein translocase subunit SecE [Clostridiales bacterium]|nr:preprotein translocase subunit SecE [Clostridiales bacterium]